MSLCHCVKYVHQPEYIEHVLWVGDTVEGVITRLDHRRRHVELSIKDRFEEVKRRGKEQVGVSMWLGLKSGAPCWLRFWPMKPMRCCSWY